MTDFPNGIMSFGIPVLGGVGGLPFNGTYYFVKPSTGSDGNHGKSPRRPLKTLSAALGKCTAGANDVVFLIAESNTAANTTDYQSATLDWNKDLTHLIGIGAPSSVSQRSRIAQLSTATGVSPLFKVSANGCYFANFQVFHGVADATSLICTQVTGDRNAFDNVHFAGMGDLSKTQSAAGCASLSLDGGDENVFRNCVIGLDSATRDADATELLCDSGASRNRFEDCLFQAYIDAAGAALVTIADTTGIDRWLWFKRCLFVSESTNKTVDMTEVFDVPAGISQGKIILQDCAVMNDGGAPVWTAGTEGIIWANMGAPTAAAAGGFMTNL